MRLSLYTLIIIIQTHTAALFLLCAVKVPDGVTEMMMAEFHHQEACQRINSILKFYTVWRFRYQVWPRMEEGAQQIFKVLFMEKQLTVHFLCIFFFVVILFYILTISLLSILKKTISVSLSACMLFHRFLHPALTSRCPLLSWECLVCPYLTPHGFLLMQALFRMQLVKISL